MKRIENFSIPSTSGIGKLCWKLYRFTSHKEGNYWENYIDSIDEFKSFKYESFR